MIHIRLELFIINSWRQFFKSYAQDFCSVFSDLCLVFHGTYHHLKILRLWKFIWWFHIIKNDPLRESLKRLSPTCYTHPLWWRLPEFVSTSNLVALHSSICSQKCIWFINLEWGRKVIWTWLVFVSTGSIYTRCSSHFSYLLWYSSNNATILKQKSSLMRPSQGKAVTFEKIANKMKRGQKIFWQKPYDEE